MLMLVSGLLLWSFAHLFPSLAPEKRQSIIDKRGEKAYKAAFAICILAGLALIVFGWRSMTMIAAYREPLYVAPIGLMHFAMGSQMSGIVPSWLPFPIFWVYFTGLSLIAAAVALIINKKAKLAMTLLGVELLIFVVFIHIIIYFL